MTGSLRQIFSGNYHNNAPGHIYGGYVGRLFFLGLACVLAVSLLNPAYVIAGDNTVTRDSQSEPESSVTETQPSVPDAKAWLKQMALAFHGRTYQGVFVYQSGRSLENFSLVHKVDDEGVEHSLLLVLDGPPREVVRKGNEVAVYGQQNSAVRFGDRGELPIVNSALGQGADRLGQWYDLGITGLDRVAGRMAVVIDVRPRDRYRYGYRLWLDRETALLLKSVMLDESGQGLERFQFVMLQTAGKVTEEALSPKLDGEPHRYTVESSNVEEQQDPKGGDWSMGWKPDGYRLVSYTTRSAHPATSEEANSPAADAEKKGNVSEPANKQSSTDAVIDVMTFSDGLSGFSVFVEPENSWMLSQPSYQFGATSAVSKVYREGKQNYNITVVGEIPKGAAEHIAVAVQPTNAVQPEKVTVEE